MAEQKIELINSESARWYAEDLGSLLDEGTLAERRAFLKSFIKEIKVTGNEVLLTYTMPTLPDGIEQEKVVIDTVNVVELRGFEPLTP